MVATASHLDWGARRPVSEEEGERDVGNTTLRKLIL